MSEYLWTPKQPEKEPHAKITVGDSLEFEANRHNSALWHFLGNIALFNCIQIDHVDEEDNTLMMFSFAPHYKKLSAYMMKQAFPIHGNQTEVPQAISDAYHRTVMQGFEGEDFIPEGWE